MPAKHTLAHVQDLFRQAGLEPRFSEYRGNIKPLRCKCSQSGCDNDASIGLITLQEGYLPKCSVCKPAAQRAAHSHRQRQDVPEFLAAIGSGLLEPYQNNHALTLFKCVGCDAGVRLAFRQIRRGSHPRCDSCKRAFWEARSGPNHHCWNPDATEEERQSRKKGGRGPLLDRWYEDVKSAADYTCQLTGERGGTLVAHHIYSCTAYPTLRTHPFNGFCMREDIHQHFHYTWLLPTKKTRRCTKDHLIEYIQLHYPHIDAIALLKNTPSP